MSYILAMLTAIIVFCSFLLLDTYMADRRRKESLRARLSADGTLAEAGYDTSYRGLNTDPSPAATALLRLLRAIGVDVDAAMKTLELRFTQAGIASPDAPIYYLFFQRIVALGVGILALVMAASAGENKLLTYAIALFLAAFALFGPKLFLKNLIDRRKQVLQRAFPDTLDLLLICIESGLALDASLNRVCSELGRAYPEMTAELNRTRLELSLLNDRVRALTNLGERTDMVAFRSLTSALIQSERFGTSLTDTLRVLSDDFRLQRLTDAEAKAARLPVLMTIPLIFLLMPAFFLIVLGPAIVKFNNDGSQVTGK